MVDYSTTVMNIRDIPDYLANNELRMIVNVGVHDIVRHADTIKKPATVTFNLTANEKIGSNRILKCETSLESGTHGDISYTVVGRTVVQPDKQHDIVKKELTLTA